MTVLRLLSLALLFPAALPAQGSILNFLPVTGREARAGTELLGQLQDTDATMPWGHRVQAWTYQGRSGEAVRIDLRSNDFDAFLFLSGPGMDNDLTDDDGGEGLNSRLCAVLPSNGTYRIVAASLGGQSGRYSITIAPDADAASGGCEDDAANTGDITDVSQLSTEGRVLTVGSTQRGSLTPHGTTFFNRPVQAYGFEARRGQTVTFDLHSEAFDAFLVIVGPGLTEPLSDDDGAGGCNSRIVFEAPSDGLYRVVASGLGSPEGSYTLAAHRQAPAATHAPCVPPSSGNEGNPADMTPTGALTLGRATSGRLSGSEPQWSSRPVHAWTLSGRAGDRIRIDLQSDEFDAYLGLMGPGYETILTNDDGGDGLNSRLCLVLPAPGTYRVLTAAFGSSGQGTYTVSAVAEACEPLTLSTAQRTEQLTALTTTGRLRPEVEAQGTLTGSEPAHPDRGTPVQLWTIDAQAGQTLTVDMMSTAFDAYLFVSGPGLEVLSNDDGGGCRNARVAVTFPERGTYRVLATAFSTGAAGAYRLIATTTPGPARPCETEEGTTSTVDGSEVANLLMARDRLLPRPQPAGRPGAGIAQLAGMEINSALATTDERIGSGRRAQVWGLQLQAGDEVTVDLMSAEFDAYLYVTGPGIAGAYGDDDGGDGLNSRIVFTATANGTYRLVASALQNDATGAFTLRIVRRVSGN
ncbi:MAG: PPC domain-containing protein [Gemmatimonadales bacterium]